MVGANTFRNPGLVAKMATTLDQLSGGRAVLGIGGAWFDREHEAFGIDFGSGFGERLDRMDESVMLLRRLLDGETVTHDGPVYTMKDALVAPRPLQAHLPIMIGGSGPKKTLRTLARYGDQWNASGSPDELAASDAILREHCAAVGRDQREIERTTTVDVMIRDSREAATAACRVRMAASGEKLGETWGFFFGTPEEVADGLRPHRGARVPAPARGHADAVRSRDDRPARRGHRTAQRMTRAVASFALAGGVGGAKLADGLQSHLGERLAVVVNTGDDCMRHGLLVMPDHDTVLYNLAGIEQVEWGWGIEGDTHAVMAQLGAYGEETWFASATATWRCTWRAQRRLRDGAGSPTCAVGLQRSLGIAARILPMTDAPVATEVRTADGWLEFQEYFVHRRQAPEVLEVRFTGIDAATPTPEVRPAVASAAAIVVAPSNPVVSIGPILAVPGMRAALCMRHGRGAPGSSRSARSSAGGRSRDPRTGCSPRWATSRQRARGRPALRRAADMFVLDTVDAGLAARDRGARHATLVTDTIMADDPSRARLAGEVLAAL